MPSAGVQVVLYPVNKSLDGRLFAFQCGPLEELSVDHNYDHTTYITLGAGEMSRPYARKLRTLSFDTLIVEDFPSAHSWTRNVPARDRGVALLANRLRKICEEGEAFRLVITDKTETVVDMSATLRTLKLTDKSGEPGTRYVSLSFSEYRAYKGVAVTRGKDKAAPGKPKVVRHSPKYTIAARYHTGTKKWSTVVKNAGTHKRQPHLEAKLEKLDQPHHSDFTLHVLSTIFYGKGWHGSATGIRKASKIGRWGSNTTLNTLGRFRNKTHTIVIPSVVSK